MRYLTTTKNLFDISGVFSAPTLCFDVSSLEIGKTYTFSSKKPIMVFKISNMRGGYNSVWNYPPASSGFTTFTFVMARDEHIPVNEKQYLFLWLPELNTTGDINTSGYVTDISQLDGYNLQIELGNTATDYVPYGYLPMYKGRYKVSNVCQLLDKSKYPATKTVYGVTFTNNGDGTFTANGTATAIISYRVLSNNAKINVVVGHKYLMRGCPAGGSKDTYEMRVPFLGFDYGNGLIAKLVDSGADYYMQIIVRAGIVCDNLVFKPQLFDLTEMYGAGHEPTTVEEFRTKFPNELYDYKPYCFVKSYKTLLKATDNKIITSYKKSLVCKTKNLFDINSAVKVSGFSSFSKNVNQITVSMNDGNRYRSANVLLDTSLAGKTVTFRAYAKTSDKNTACLRIQWLTSRGSSSSAYIESNNVSGQAYQTVRLTGIIPAQPDDEHSTLCLSFYSNGYNTTTTLPSQLYTVVYTDIQLELGDTATEYHPYGYL